VIVQASTDEQIFETLKPEWNKLVHNSHSNRIFSTWEWNRTWWMAYRPGSLWVITIRDDNQHLIGIAPCFIESTSDRGRVVRLIGCVDVTDYVDLIIDSQAVEGVLQALVQFIEQMHSAFDRLDFCNLPEASPAYQRLPDLLREHLFSVSVKQQEVCPIIMLPGDWETYVESLDKKDRHELRRKLRRIEGAEEAVDWYIVGTEHDLAIESQRFLDLMASSQEQKHVFLQNPRNRDFFNQIVPIAFEHGWLQMSFLTINGEACACYFNFVYDSQVQVYNSGLNLTKFSHLGPGIILLAFNIKYAIEHGFKAFDFLRGNESYKYRMGAKDSAVYNLEAHLASD
jgi:CelD/BcsL family acetyltransferase involved in cellulose biosynthesis